MELLRQQRATFEQQSHPSITDPREMRMPKKMANLIFALAFFFPLPCGYDIRIGQQFRLIQNGLLMADNRIYRNIFQ
jgi:hypothetical protein